MGEHEERLLFGTISSPLNESSTQYLLRTTDCQCNVIFRVFKFNLNRDGGKVTPLVLAGLVCEVRDHMSD